MSFFNKILVSTAAVLFSISHLEAGNEGPHGSDAFDYSPVGNGYKYFDYMEFGNSFRPEKLEEFKPIDEMLKKLEPSFPLFVKGIRHVYASSFWSLVDPEAQLKDSPPTGDTNLIITVNRVQAALALPDRLTVQINSVIWKALEPIARTFLLLHEMFWLAELSPLLYRMIQPNTLLIHQGKEMSNSGWFDDRSIEERNLKGVVNADDISTTSEAVRRLTGYLSGELPVVEAAPLNPFTEFLFLNLGRVNQSHPKRVANGGSSLYPVFFFDDNLKVGWLVSWQRGYDAPQDFGKIIYLASKAVKTDLTPLGYFLEKDILNAKQTTHLENELKVVASDSSWKNMREKFSKASTAKLSDVSLYKNWRCTSRDVDLTTRDSRVQMKMEEDSFAGLQFLSVKGSLPKNEEIRLPVDENSNILPNYRKGTDGNPYVTALRITSSRISIENLKLTGILGFDPISEVENKDLKAYEYLFCRPLESFKAEASLKTKGNCSETNFEDLRKLATSKAVTACGDAGFTNCAYKSDGVRSAKNSWGTSTCTLEVEVEGYK